MDTANCVILLRLLEFSSLYIWGINGELNSQIVYLGV